MKKYLKNDGGMEKKSYLCTEFGVECARGHTLTAHGTGEEARGHTLTAHGTGESKQEGKRGTTRESRTGEGGSRKQPRELNSKERRGAAEMPLLFPIDR